MTTASDHSLFEDLQALVSGTLLFAFAIVLFRQAGLLTGGTAGLAFLGHYASDVSFGLLYFLINIPFYIFGLLALGKAFTLKTFAAVALPWDDALVVSAHGKPVDEAVAADLAERGSTPRSTSEIGAAIAARLR